MVLRQRLKEQGNWLCLYRTGVSSFKYEPCLLCLPDLLAAGKRSERTEALMG